MFDRLLTWFSTPSPDPVDRERQGRVAAAALLQELAACDHDFRSVEYARIVRTLAVDFGLSAELAEALMGDARREREGGASLQKLAVVVRDAFGVEEKKKIVTAMWKVVLVDGTVDATEERLVETFTALLGIDRKTVAEARKAVTQQTVIEDDE